MRGLQSHKSMRGEIEPPCGSITRLKQLHNGDQLQPTKLYISGGDDTHAVVVVESRRP